MFGNSKISSMIRSMFSPFSSISSICISKFFLNMERLSFLAGVIGSIFSMFLYLSPIKTFSQIVKHRSTEEFESLPYISTLLNSSVGIYYGVMKPGMYLLAISSGLGTLIQLVYVVLFLIYAPPKMRAKTAILVGVLDVGFLAAVFLITQYTMHGDLRIEVLGFIRAGLSIVMFASPLVAMKRVVMTKSVEYMPFLLSFCLFSNGVIWTCYAILVKDFSIKVSSGTGFVLGTLQLVLYAIYWKRKPPSNRILDELDNGWQHKRLLNENNQDV